ncbi:MAG: YibE/F family protein [Hydrogeniiclostridium sp.]
MIRHSRDMLKRVLQVVLPMVILIGIVIGSCQIHISRIGSDMQAVYVKASVNEILEDYTNDTPFVGNQKVLATVTSGEYAGRTCELENSNSYQRGALCYPGTKIIALLQENSDGSLTGSVYNYDRTDMIYLLLGLFAVILVLVGGMKGAAALYALVFTFVCIICMYIPFLCMGMNGILAAILTSVVILVVSIYILNGWSVKSACAIVGTTVGIAVSGLLAMVIGLASNLTGYNMQDVESMVYIANGTNLDVTNILYAGILISSLGAVMDVSVSMVAAMQEVHEKAPQLTSKELFLSGMRIGRDTMGTNSNTLILAYTGSATSVFLTVYCYQMSFLQIAGYNSIIIEILCSLCGTIGVVLTVPLQAVITTVALKSRMFRRKTKTSQS